MYLLVCFVVVLCMSLYAVNLKWKNKCYNTKNGEEREIITSDAGESKTVRVLQCGDNIQIVVLL